MKKLELSRLALTGMISGLVALSQGGLEGMQDGPSIDVQNLLAKPACKGKGGCGGFTADRALHEEAVDEDEEEEDNDDASEADSEVSQRSQEDDPPKNTKKKYKTS